MRTIPFALVSLCLFSTPVCGYAQTVGKPVLTPAQPAAPEAHSPAATGPVDQNTYIIGAEDQIQVTVWHETQLSSAIMVRPDGKISLPLIGDIQAAGYTTSQLADNIRESLKKYLSDPVVDVTLVASKSKMIYMVGEIAHVGPIPIAPGMTILQAIATAGGLTPFANPKKIYILRGDTGHQHQIPFNYNKAKKGDMQGITLQPGDTIVVP